MNQKEWIHPCQTCGACCAAYRVSFYWREAEKNDTTHPVPAAYWEDANSQYRIMKGTTHKHLPKCIALKGRIGDFVSCEIYESRPSPCKHFSASYEYGIHQIRCDEARAKHGLQPLHKRDWNLNHVKKNSDSTSEI